MRKRLLFIYTLFLCLLPAMLSAQSRSLSDAREIARTYFNQTAKVATRSDVQPVLVTTSGKLLKKDVVATRAGESDEAFYVFNEDNRRFVIVSGDERMKEILGYSEHGAFVDGDVPENMKTWLTMYVREKEALSQTSSAYKVLPNPGALTRSASFPASVAPLLGKIAWDQDTPYNNLCPKSGNQRTAAGCVATAMAQVMKYYGYPAQGQHSYTYTTKTLNVECSFDFSTQYKWDKMLDTYVKDGYTDEQAEAVATLMYACGVGVDMNYNLSENRGSGASSMKVVSALKKYFNYDPNMRFCIRDFYSYSEWMELIKTELSEGRPIFYGGYSESVGHQFVFDGYDKNDMMHINWGWGGTSNGYFSVTALDPDELGIGGGTSMNGFTYRQDMIIGVRKPRTDAQQRYVSHFLMDLDLETSKTEANLGTSFNISINDIFNYTDVFTGKLAVLLVKDGQVIELYSRNISNLGIYRGWKVVDTQCTVPVGTAEGVYQIRVASKAQNETEWQYVRGKLLNVHYLNAEIKNGKVYLSVPDMTPSLEADMQIVRTLYKDRTGAYTLQLRNTGTEEAHVEASVVAALKGTDEYKSVCKGMVFLKPNESKEVTLSSKVELDAGEYKFLPVFNMNDKQVNFRNNPLAQEATVKATPEDSKELTVLADIELSNEEIAPGEILKVRTTLKNKSGLYDNDVYVAVLKRTADGTKYSFFKYFRKHLFIESDSQFQLEHDILIEDWEAERYMVIIMATFEGEPQILNLEGEGTIARARFTITTTGIEENPAEEGFILYPSPVVDMLHVKLPTDINRMEIVSLNGQVVKRDNERMLAGTTRVIPVADIAAGYYILVLHGDNKMYRQKFMKK